MHFSRLNHSFKENSVKERDCFVVRLRRHENVTFTYNYVKGKQIAAMKHLFKFPFSTAWEQLLSLIFTYFHLNIAD